MLADLTLYGRVLTETSVQLDASEDDTVESLTQKIRTPEGYMVMAAKDLCARFPGKILDDRASLSDSNIEDRDEVTFLVIPAPQ